MAPGSGASLLAGGFVIPAFPVGDDGAVELRNAAQAAQGQGEAILGHGFAPEAFARVFVGPDSGTPQLVDALGGQVAAVGPLESRLFQGIENP